MSIITERRASPKAVALALESIGVKLFDEEGTPAAKFFAEDLTEDELNSGWMFEGQAGRLWHVTYKGPHKENHPNWCQLKFLPVEGAAVIPDEIEVHFGFEPDLATLEVEEEVLYLSPKNVRLRLHSNLDEPEPDNYLALEISVADQTGHHWA